MITTFAHIEQGVSNSGYFDNMMDDGHWNSGGSFTFLWMFLLMVVIALLIALFYNMANKSGQASQSKNDALGILKDRYVKGEITKKQYDEMKDDIA